MGNEFGFFQALLRGVKNNRGQSTVEYVLMLSVVLSITIGILRSDIFKKTFGDESEVFEGHRKAMEHSYRHGFPGNTETIVNKQARYQVIHESYFSNGDTHFFYPDAYGN